VISSNFPGSILSKKHELLFIPDLLKLTRNKFYKCAETPKTAISWIDYSSMSRTKHLLSAQQHSILPSSIYYHRNHLIRNLTSSSFFQGCLHNRLAFSVKSRRRFIQHKNFRVANDSASYGNSLLLSSAQLSATLTDQCFEFLRKQLNSSFNSWQINELQEGKIIKSQHSWRYMSCSKKEQSEIGRFLQASKRVLDYSIFDFITLKG